MKPEFKKLLQLGIIVEDVDKSVENYEKLFGIGPWRISTVDKNDFPNLQVTSKGKNDDMANKCAFCNAFGMEIELIEPLRESPYKAWLDTHGPGIHHIAMITEGGFNEVLDTCEKITGEKAWIHGKDDSIGMDFAYVDLSKVLGFFVEIYNEDRTQQNGHEF